MKYLNALGLAGMILLGGCAPRQDADKEEASLRELSASWLGHAMARDAMGVASLFAPDGVMYWEDEVFAEGRERILEHQSTFLQFEDYDSTSFGAHKVWMAESADLGVELGWTDGGGKYITVSQQQGPGWRIAANIWVGGSAVPDWAADHLSQWYAFSNAEDAAGLASLYTTDAAITGRAVGREAIARLFRERFAESNQICAGHFDEFFVVEDMAIAKGRDTCVDTAVDGGRTTSHFQWISTYDRQADGTWLLSRDRGSELAVEQSSPGEAGQPAGIQ